MNATPLITIAERAGARVVGIEKLERLEEVQVTGFIHDSRQVRVGDVFVALEGRNTDGHKFLKHARDKGAVAALVKKGNNWEEVAGLVLLECEDPLASLQRVARWWRGELKAVVIAISGCSGKTSTKRMLASILKKAGSVTSTPGNWNNQIGLPLTILNACREDEYAVWELGSNRPGEIAELARMARPMFSIVTNIGTAHIEFFGNRMGIALEEGSVFSETAKEGGCFYPGRDDFADTLEWLAGERARPVYLDAGDPSAKDIRNGVDGIRFVLNMRGRGHAVRLKQPGRHIVMDSLLATAVAIQMGMDGERIVQGLEESSPEDGRMVVKNIGGVWFWDDSYNANPESMIAGLRSMKDVEGTGFKRIAVLGRMGELGEYLNEGNRRVGMEAARCCDVLVCVGEGTEGIAAAGRMKGMENVWEVRDVEGAVGILCSIVRKGDLVLVKGSRMAKMERVFTLLEERLGGEDSQGKEA